MAAVAPAIPYIMMAVGTAAQISAQNEAAKDRRNQINAAYDQLDQGTSKSSKVIADAAQQYGADQRQQAMDAQTQAIQGQQTKDLGGAGGNIIDGAGDAGNVSQDYLTAKADRAVSEGTRLSRIAAQIAKTRAPSMLMNQEGLNNADAASNVASIWGSAKGMAGAFGNGAASVQEPAYGQIGGLVSQAGGAMAAGGYGSTPKAGVVSGGSGVGNVSSNQGLQLTSGGSGSGLKLRSNSIWGRA